MIVEGLGKLYSFTARGRYGKSRGFGTGSFGFGDFGYDDEMSGVWQRKKTKKGWRWSLMIYARPPTSNTILQAIQRTKFRNGFNAWRALTEDEKNAWRKKAKPYHISGFNLHMRRWLNSH